MIFKILKVFLIPKDKSKENRIVPFDIDNINVITGASAKGKSAITYIIDYCLGSSKCRIPIGLIREKTEWFGIHVRLQNTEIIITRYEPSLGLNGCCLESGSSLEIRNDYEENMNIKDVIAYLNSQLGLSDIKLDPENESPLTGAVSVRDLVSMTYQPQNIVANSNSLFYRIETFEYRERLKRTLPYLLGIVTPEILRIRATLKRLKAHKTTLLNQLRKYEKTKEDWFASFQSYYTLANEYGLIKSNINVIEDNRVTINYLYENLKTVLRFLEDDSGQIPIIEEGITKKIANQLNDLINRQDLISNSIFSKKSKLVALKRSMASNSQYLSSLNDQTNRLSSVDWFLEKVEDEKCFACGHQSNSEDYLSILNKIDDDIHDIKLKVSDYTRVTHGEIQKTQEGILKEERELNDVRAQINNLTIQNDQFKKRTQNVRKIYSFIGEIVEILKNYDLQFTGNSYSSDLRAVNERISSLESSINEDKLKKKEAKVLSDISYLIMKYANIFDAENKLDKPILDLKELSIHFINNEGEKNYLWEIGSAHNYLAYHLSTFFAIHEYLHNKVSVVPQFLIIDQPSQVYFPELEDDNESLSTDDVTKVGYIFKALSEFNKATNGDVQVILFEHVGKSSFAGYDNIHLTARWRQGESDSALIPRSWF